MLTALVHFVIGFSVVSGIAYGHARLLQETNGSFLSAGLITGLVCASLATFATEWATPVVIVLFGLSSHKEYLEARRYKAQSKATGLESKENAASLGRMGCQVASFGDNVRVRTTPETEARGIAGLSGQVYGVTTPSVTGVAVIGDCGEDFALNVSIAEINADYWLAPDLVELVDHAPGTTVRTDGSPVQSVRNTDGTWTEEAVPMTRRPWWKHW